MQEILFKALSLKGKWVYGNLLISSDRKKVKIYTPNDDKYYEVFRKSVCQYTGKKGASGVKLFENDICEYTAQEYDKTEHTEQCTIYWNDQEAMFDYGDGSPIGDTSDLTVVGNVYDELLKYL